MIFWFARQVCRGRFEREAIYKDLAVRREVLALEICKLDVKISAKKEIIVAEIVVEDLF